MGAQKPDGQEPTKPQAPPAPKPENQPPAADQAAEAKSDSPQKTGNAPTGIRNDVEK